MDINLVKEKLLQNNTKLDSDIVQRTGALGQILSIYIRDPDLNLIEISQYVDKKNS
ncbi:hypothetical protein [Campylobacter mucosalis]|uniref:hypothetical protein n=1 Tax=Campylobacter mucosalis TaxID=202 RepID=UPI00201690E3|nr:hypothetical protein [Campylobacter mucosalis]